MALVAAVSAPAAGAQTSRAADQTALTLTVYRQNLALVGETRRIATGIGGGSLIIRDIPAALIPETVLAGSIPPGRLRIVEQRLETGLLTPEALLKAAVGGTVDVIQVNPTTGAERYAPAEILRAQGREALLRIDGRIRVMDVRRIAFGTLPTGLRAEPTLILTFEGDKPAKALTLRYLTGGLSWQANYVAALNATETAIRLTGWATLSNKTGTTFRDARLRLVSGAINRAGRPKYRREAMISARALTADAPATLAVSDLHVFDFDRPVTIAGNETRQLALLPATTVAVTKEYRLVGGTSPFNRLRRGSIQSNPAIRFRFENMAQAGRGLPAGIVRFYADGAGMPVLLGESRIRYTPPGGRVSATVGRAVDIIAERKQTDFRRDGLPRGVFETAHAITLRNAKDVDVSVTVIEPIPGDWKMLTESQPHEREDAGAARWQINIPAGGERTLEYRVRVRF